jgi:hypothetical protein
VLFRANGRQLDGQVPTREHVSEPQFRQLIPGETPAVDDLKIAVRPEVAQKERWDLVPSP